MTADHQLTGAVALDAVGPTERKRFERHLGDCSACTQELYELQETAALLSRASATPPPAGLRERVLDEVARTRQLPPPTRVTTVDRSPRRRVAAAAAIAAVLLLAVSVGAALLERAHDVRRAEVLAAADATRFDLRGGAGRAQVVWSPQQQRMVLSADALPAPPDGSTYELWFLDGGAPTRAIEFEPDASGRVDRDFATPVGRVEALAVSIEPDGGSASPTGAIVLATPG